MRRLGPVFLLAGCGLLTPGCFGSTLYQPQVVARGELTLRYHNGFELWAEGRRVARGLGYRGLPEYVGCVPAARQHAEGAVRDGRTATAGIILGASFGALSLGGLSGVAIDRDLGTTFWAITGAGLTLAVSGAIFAGVARLYRNRANGQAVDAMNLYNDSVGSLGATCADLRYPASAGPLPPTDAPPDQPLPPPPTAEDSQPQ